SLHLRSFAVDRLRELHRISAEVMTDACEICAFTRQLANVYLSKIKFATTLTRLTRAQNLLDCLQKPIAVGQHHIVKFLSLVLFKITRLQGLEIKPNGSEGCFKFVSYCVDECVVLL